MLPTGLGQWGTTAKLATSAPGQLEEASQHFLTVTEVLCGPASLVTEVPSDPASLVSTGDTRLPTALWPWREENSQKTLADWLQPTRHVKWSNKHLTLVIGSGDDTVCREPQYRSLWEPQARARLPLGSQQAHDGLSLSLTGEVTWPAVWLCGSVWLDRVCVATQVVQAGWTIVMWLLAHGQLICEGRCNL